MDTDARDALASVGRYLAQNGYAFVTVTPETHRWVNERAEARGLSSSRTLRDVFGWSRMFTPDFLPAEVVALLRRADALDESRPFWRSRVRFSSLGEGLYVHSAYPTVDKDSVFFGPDTYRFCDMIGQRLVETRRSSRLVDLGCGAGPGGLSLAGHADQIVLADINPRALDFAEVNARLSGSAERVEIVESDLLGEIEGEIDTIVANPPYLIDPGRRAYRDGMGHWGEKQAVDMVAASLERLTRGGRLLLYTGAAMVDGSDTFLEAVRPTLSRPGLRWRYHELDPDVFGEEIAVNEAYSSVERIAAVALVVELS